MQTTKLSIPQGVYGPKAFSTTVDQAPCFSGWQYHISGLKPMALNSLKLQSLNPVSLYIRRLFLKLAAAPRRRDLEEGKLILWRADPQSCRRRRFHDTIVVDWQALLTVLPWLVALEC